MPSAEPDRTMAPARRRQRWLLAAAGLLLPALVMLSFVVDAHELAERDYWIIMSRLVGAAGFSHHPADWLARSNEHQIILAKAILALNMVLSGGSSRVLSLLAWLAVVGQAVLLWDLWPQRPRRPLAMSLLFGLLLGAMCFNPQAAHSFVIGFSGVVWLSANLLATAAVWTLVRHERGGRTRWFWASIGSALLASATYTTSLALWPALLLAAWLLGLPRRRLWAVGLGGALVTAWWLSGYARPSHHPPISQHLWAVGSLVLAMLGRILSEQLAVAAIFGALAVATLLWLGRGQLAEQTSRRAAAAPVALAAYAVGAVLLTALGRAGFGLAMSMSSRYASLPSLAWCALVMLGLLRVEARAMRPGRGVTGSPATWSLLSAALIIGAYRTGLPTLRRFAADRRVNELAAAALRAGVADPGALGAVAFDPSQLAQLAPTLRRLRQVPFRQGEHCPLLGSRLPAPREDTPRASRWAGPSPPGGARYAGTTSAVDDTAVGRNDCIVLLDSSGRVRGFGAAQVRWAEPVAQPAVGHWAALAPAPVPATGLWARLLRPGRAPQPLR